MEERRMLDTMTLRLIAYRRSGKRWYRLWEELATEGDGRKRRKIRRLLAEEELREDAMFEGMCREVEAAAAAIHGGQHVGRGK